MRSGSTIAVLALVVGSFLLDPGPANAQHMMDNAVFHYSVLDVDATRVNEAMSSRWDAAGWVGTDFDRLWWSTNGEGVDRELESAEVELLYGRYVRTFWDVVVGYRQQIEPVSQAYLTFGLMGLAPYWFEVALMGAISHRGAPSLQLEAENDLFVSQRLVVTVGGELDWLITDDDGFDLPSGVGAAEVGLRARYEIRRKFAPYLDLTWERVPQARIPIAGGGEASGFRLGAGLRLIY